MQILAVVIGILCIVGTLQDSFEAIVLPRRVSRKMRMSRLYYAWTWKLWAAIGRKMRPGNRREFYLGYFGPLSLILLLILWALLLILGFALIQWGCGDVLQAPEKNVTFGTYLYLSGTTFVTLGFGDVVPLTAIGRILAVGEAGMGFGFLALIIGYVPIIYQAFSRREIQIALLDARAGTPPSATELLRRHYRDQSIDELVSYLKDWEKWCADILESHLSYPVLIYYRSQHERQSWLASLTTVLDTCALLIVGFEGVSTSTVRFAYAIARHAAVDLGQTFGTGMPSRDKIRERLSSEDFARMRDALAEVGLRLRGGEQAEQRLAEIRRIYEPFVLSLSDRLLVNLPPWVASERTVDDWQTSAWDHFAQWSPERLNEITHILIDHRKKMPLLKGAAGKAAEEHAHSHPHAIEDNHGGTRPPQ